MEQWGGGAQPKYVIVYVIRDWGFTSLEKRNYSYENISVSISHKVVIIIHVWSVIIGVFRRIKIFIIILYKLVDLIEVVQIKISLWMLKCLSTDSAKSCTLSALVLAVFASSRKAG